MPGAVTTVPLGLIGLPDKPVSRRPVWPLAVLLTGVLLTGLWVLLLVWTAYRSLLWLLGTG